MEAAAEIEPIALEQAEYLPLGIVARFGADDERNRMDQGGGDLNNRHRPQPNGIVFHNILYSAGLRGFVGRRLRNNQRRAGF